MRSTENFALFTTVAWTSKASGLRDSFQVMNGKTNVLVAIQIIRDTLGGHSGQFVKKRRNEALYSPNCTQMQYFGPCAMLKL